MVYHKEQEDHRMVSEPLILQYEIGKISSVRLCFSH
mgnify:FL=1